MQNDKHQLYAILKSLRLPGIADNLDARVQEAQDNRLGYIDFLLLLTQDERNQRDNNHVAKLISQAGFGAEKTFEGFDLRFNEKAIEPSLLRDLRTCSFADLGKNIVIAGPPGIGKTHIAKALGHELCRRKKRVIYRKATELLRTLITPKTTYQQEREYKRVLRADLVILDDFALRKYDSREVEALYQIVDDGSTRKVFITTSNRPPQDWLSVFPDPVVGGALLDRMVSGATKLIVKIGRSYRKEGTVEKKQKEGKAKL